MEKGVRGLLSFLGLYHKLAEGDISTHELFEAYNFLRKFFLPESEKQETVAGRVPEGAPLGAVSDRFPLGGNASFTQKEQCLATPSDDAERRKRHQEHCGLEQRFLNRSPSRVDAALAFDAFIHEVHAHDCTLLGKAFDLTPDVASDIALPLLDSLAGKTPESPIRKQVRGYATLLGEEMFVLKGTKPIIIAGYASVELIDREKHLIPRETLDKAFKEFMARKGRENIQFAHTNFQAGRVLPEWTSPTTGQTYTSGVDDKGLFIVGEVYSDTTVGDRIVKEVQKGSLRAFSISGLGKQVVPKNGFKEVQELELYEITLCHEPVNQGAFFEVVKGGGVSIEKVMSAFQRALPLGWTVSVNDGVTLPFGYTDAWLERSLKMNVGRYPALHGTYELELRPFFKPSLGGIRLGSCDVALVGSVLKKGFSVHDCDLLINHPRSSLGLTLYRCLSKSLPVDLRSFARFLFEPEGAHSVAQPLMYLCARRVEGS